VGALGTRTRMQTCRRERDWILSRIVWLGGLEDGKNRGGAVNTYARYIYIHGTPDQIPLGAPRSHGCIRMRNDDVIELFAELEPGMRVEIDES
jgi:L,D-transpeptidase YbiS